MGPPATLWAIAREERLGDRRQHLRFDKVFTVYLTTPDGMMRGIGRNISARGLFVETREPVALGGKLKVTFAGEDGTEMTCLCEVRYQVALSYGKGDGAEGHTRGIGLRIVAYETKEDQPLLLVARERVLH
ncbi:MAG: PilZ domain-containing protein [Myxococcales bacterium]|nr:PilZ domain-containing protein [Myxococcales bacterium]